MTNIKTILRQRIYHYLYYGRLVYNTDSLFHPFHIWWILQIWLSLTEKEEHDFLKGICLAALSADRKNVKFVAAVDENGKLIAGEYGGQFFKNINNTAMIKSSIFYLHYLIPALRQNEVRKDCPSQDPTKDNNMFHLTKLQDLGDNVYLVVTQLTEKKDRYLCMYMECYPSSKIMTYGQIISKISNSF